MGPIESRTRKGPLLVIHIPMAGDALITLLTEACFDSIRIPGSYPGELRLRKPETAFLECFRCGEEKIDIILGHFEIRRGDRRGIRRGDSPGRIGNSPGDGCRGNCVVRIGERYKSVPEFSGLSFLHREISCG